MADKIIPDFTELNATPADDDTLLIYDASAGSPRTRSITVANLLSGVDVEAASATSAGIVELATSAETITGTDTARATTPAGVAASIANALLTAGSGDVVGPGSATDNAVARFDSTTGKLVQNSSAIISDAGDLTVASLALTTDLAVTHGGTGASTAATARTTLGAADRSFAVKTTTYTATAGDKLMANTSSAAFTITLPATPASGDCIEVVDALNTWETNNLTLDRNGSSIEGLAESLICDVEGSFVQLVYVGGSIGWRVR